MIRRVALPFALALALASYALPQEAPAKSETQAEENPMTGWKWANFLILAAGIGYLIGKNVPPLFRKQSDEIQAALAEAAKIKHEAGLYAAGVEARLKNLEREIELAARICPRRNRRRRRTAACGSRASPSKAS